MSDVKRGRYFLYKNPGFKRVPYGPRPRRQKCPAPKNVSKIKLTLNIIIFIKLFLFIKFRLSRGYRQLTVVALQKIGIPHKKNYFHHRLMEVYQMKVYLLVKNQSRSQIAVFYPAIQTFLVMMIVVKTRMNLNQILINQF